MKYWGLSRKPNVLTCFKLMRQPIQLWPGLSSNLWTKFDMHHGGTPHHPSHGWLFLNIETQGDFFWIILRKSHISQHQWQHQSCLPALAGSLDHHGTWWWCFGEVCLDLNARSGEAVANMPRQVLMHPGLVKKSSNVQKAMVGRCLECFYCLRMRCFPTWNA